MNYEIVPLNVGNFEALWKDTCLYRMYRGETYKAPCIMWYIKGSKNNIIVDLGPPEPEQALKNHGLVMSRSEKQEIPNALKTIGLTPEDIKMIIITHLHYDHAWGFHVFKNAKFLLQKKEISYAIAPLPCHVGNYYEMSLGKPQFVDYLDKIQVINGDYEVEDGITAVYIPSHSPGFQGVLVNTVKGKYFIAGDALGLFECWERIPHVPSSIFNNLDEYYESMDKIEKIADFILPGHDNRVFDKSIYP
jgi:N-acyl homoserine lactone hydrolase